MSEQTTVVVREGAVAGAIERGVRIWRGIPYAAAPVGAGTFLAPQPAARWDGVRDATRAAPVAMQPAIGSSTGQESMSEDSLRLTIWSPPDADRLPVMVWIHGGGYLAGSADTAVTNGARLASEGPVVVVSIAYRLGYRGFLDLRSVPGAAGRADTNVGLRDQIAALRWVQEHVAAFGGDPDRVTVLGQSAGGGSVCCLVASPLARGLLHGAVAQSPPAASVFDAAQAATVTASLLALLGRPDATVDELLAIDPAAVLGASGRLLGAMIEPFPGHHAMQPVVDGDVLLDTPVRSIAAGHGSSVPLLIGSDEHEGSLFATPMVPPLIPTSPTAVRTFLAREHPGAVERILRAYAGHGAFGEGVAIGGDGMVTVPAMAVAEAMSAHAPAYAYRLRWTNADLMAKRLGSPHTLDAPLVFGTLDAYPLTDLADGDAATLSERMRRAWLAFAATGSPSTADAPWDPYSPDSRTVMVLDSTSQAVVGLDEPLRAAWGPRGA